MSSVIINPHITRIIRTKRRTIALQIQPDGCLVVRAPRHINDSYIHQVVHAKRRWIEKKQAFVKKCGACARPKEFIEGEEFLYLGEKFKLNIIERDKPALVLNGGFSLARRYRESARQIFIQWYKERAKEIIIKRVEHYAVILDERYNKISITSAQARWGSCSRKGNLNFSWRIAMAPMSVIDYVVTHEMIHLREKNHRKGFWAKVRAIMPEYKKEEKWLKEHRHLMVV